MDNTYLNWTKKDEIDEFITQTNDRSKPYTGKSMLVMMYPKHEQAITQTWPNPVLWSRNGQRNIPDRSILSADDTERHMLHIICPPVRDYLSEKYLYQLEDLFHHDTSQAADKTLNDETVYKRQANWCRMKDLVKYPGAGHHSSVPEINHGTGHLGRCFQGVACIRMGRGQILPRSPVSLNHIVYGYKVMATFHVLQIMSRDYE